jgi:hypothetical protein
VELLRLHAKVLAAAAFGVAIIGIAAVATHRSSAGPGAAPGAATRVRTAGDALPAAAAGVLSQLGFRTGESRRVASATYLVPRHSDRLCVLSVFRNELPYGCGAKADFFGDDQAVASVVEDGQPGAPTRLRVFGVARSGVRSIRVIFRGVSRSVAVTGDQGFALDADAAALAAGDPLRIEALDAGGRVLKAQPFGATP